MEKTSPTVVVIDDSASVHEFFKRCLAGQNIAYRAFTSTADALPFLREQRPDVLFLDIIIPDKDGLTFLQELRRIPLQADTPVIMITSKDYAQDRMVAKTLGAVEFVLKPMRLQTIRELILKFTSGSTAGAGRTANA
ncbi:MAG: response regulator [Gammaproteobacteria bacterium]